MQQAVVKSFAEFRIPDSEFRIKSPLILAIIHTTLFPLGGCIDCIDYSHKKICEFTPKIPIPLEGF